VAQHIQVIFKKEKNCFLHYVGLKADSYLCLTRCHWVMSFLKADMSGFMKDQQVLQQFTHQKGEEYLK
jgi:hypothetical protein